MIVFLGGAISAFWQDEYKGTLLHKDYIYWRNTVQDAFVKAGHLTIRPDLMFKGKWLEKAQAVNDFAIKQSDIFVDWSPPGIPAFGTLREVWYAKGRAKPVLYAPPWDWYEIAHLLKPLDNPYEGWESADKNAYKRIK